jgi:putative salt-induced outer membrane protein YdiY
MKRYIILTLITILAIPAYARRPSADEIYLKGGDRISGIITKKETSGALLVKTESMGTVSVKKEFVRKILPCAQVNTEDTDKAVTKPAAARDEESVSWTREITAGFNRSRGNTSDDNLAGGILLNRLNKHVDEYTLKGNFFYSSAKRKMDEQKWYLMARYAYSLGIEKKWYNFFRFEADHDRFTDIDYRLVPASGIGYWFFDLPGTKFMLEAGAGVESTYFRSNIKNTLEWVFIPRAWFEKELFSNMVLTQGISYYLGFEDLSCYRLRSETAIDVMINGRLKLRFSVLDDYNAGPPKNVKKNDLRLVTSLAYSF